MPRSLYSKQQWQLSHESEEARDQSAPPTKDAPQKQADSWARPEGTVSVVAVMGEGEKVICTFLCAFPDILGHLQYSAIVLHRLVHSRP